MNLIRIRRGLGNLSWWRCREAETGGLLMARARGKNRTCAGGTNGMWITWGHGGLLVG